MKQRILDILNNIKNEIPETDFVNIKELINNSEWGIGLEIICTQIYEYEIMISSKLFFEIKSASNEMNLPSSAWKEIEFLKLKN